mmetsp:Transcript_4552/g.11313  ORF Transcript_4552/g.11313 Transcript_4552/m.11313 type:complete len:94 (-) Transcript_4552:736-1017(-)
MQVPTTQHFDFGMTTTIWRRLIWTRGDSHAMLHVSVQFAFFEDVVQALVWIHFPLLRSLRQVLDERPVEPEIPLCAALGQAPTGTRGFLERQE